MATMLEKVNSAIAIKSDIKNAIEAKGVSMASVTFGGYAEKIGEIQTGIDPTSATAFASQVLTNRTFYARDNNLHSGTMPYAVVSTTVNATTVTSGYNQSAVIIPTNNNYTGAMAALTNVNSGIHAQYVRPASGDYTISQGAVVNELEVYDSVDQIFSGTIENRGKINSLYIDSPCCIIRNTIFGSMENLYLRGGTVAGRTVTGGLIDDGIADVENAGSMTINSNGKLIATYAEDIKINGGTMTVSSGCRAERVLYDSYSSDTRLRVESGGTASVILGEHGLGMIENNGTIIYLTDTSDSDATVDDVRSGKTFYAGNNPQKLTGTAVIGGGMPAIPSSFTTLELNTPYTATGDGWIKFRIKYVWGEEIKSYLTVGDRTYSPVDESGATEEADWGYVYFEGIAPVYAGETFEMTTEGSAAVNSYLKVAYI